MCGARPTCRTVPGSLVLNCDWSRKVLETIAVLLLILWAVGLVSSYTMGGLIHLLLVVAIAVVLIRVIQGRNPV